jgi:hypothetical protein
MRAKPTSTKLCALTLGIVLFIATAHSQKVVTFDNATGNQLGYAVKALADISYKKGVLLHWRAGISSGVGAFLANDYLYPTVHIDVMLYHGGLGSRWPGTKKRSYFDAEITTSYMMTLGLQNRLRYDAPRNPTKTSYPLYYCNTFLAPPLQNPYLWSASFGGNIIWFLTRKQTKRQQVGFANVHLNRIQLSYLNDGPFFPKPFGDGFDRLHTGAGFVSYHGDRHHPVDLVEIGFNKFTGYDVNSYELANRIGTGYMYYKDTTQNYYNKSRIYANVISTRNAFGLSLNLNNFNSIDVQHRIHLGAFYPLHMVPYDSHISVAPVYYFSQTHIGLK